MALQRVPSTLDLSNGMVSGPDWRYEGRDYTTTLWCTGLLLPRENRSCDAGREVMWSWEGGHVMSRRGGEGGREVMWWHFNIVYILCWWCSFHKGQGVIENRSRFESCVLKHYPIPRLPAALVVRTRLWEWANTDNRSGYIVWRHTMDHILIATPFPDPTLFGIMRPSWNSISSSLKH